MADIPKWLPICWTGVEVRLGEDYLEKKAEYDALAEKIIYTGPIDAYFRLPDGISGSIVPYVLRQNFWISRISREMQQSIIQTERLRGQGSLSINGLNLEKMMKEIDLPKTVISREYSSEWKPGDEPYYPVNDEKNGALYSKYRELAQKEKKVVFGGRLGRV